MGGLWMDGEGGLGEDIYTEWRAGAGGWMVGWMGEVAGVDLRAWERRG